MFVCERHVVKRGVSHEMKPHVLRLPQPFFQDTRVSSRV